MVSPASEPMPPPGTLPAAPRRALFGEQLPAFVGVATSLAGWAGAAVVVGSLQARAAEVGASRQAASGLAPRGSIPDASASNANERAGDDTTTMPTRGGPPQNLAADGPAPGLDPPPGESSIDDALAGAAVARPPACPPPLRLTYDVAASRPQAPFAAALDERVAAARALPDARFVVEGHADAPGSHSSNLAISRARAERVAQGLVRRGILREHIDIQAYGEYRPLPGHSERDPANRRVELRVTSPACRPASWEPAP